MRGTWFAVLVFLAVPLMLAQSPANTAAQTPDPCAVANRPHFDVVTVKPIDGNSGSSSVHGTSDGLVMTGTLRNAILFAYSLHGFQFTGGPDWVSTSTWEIHAKNDTPNPDSTKLSQVEMKALQAERLQQVQSLLADRFQLKCHMTMKELPIYELVTVKAGATLKQAAADEAKRNSTSINGHGLQMHATATGVTAERIASILASEVDRLVVDKTGLTGSYDLTLDWGQDASAGSTDGLSGATLFTAIQEQLGLKLQSAKGPVPVLVVEAVEKPGEN